jgi:hypothetical protein
METPICMFYEVILDEILKVEDYGLLYDYYGAQRI